MQFCQIENWLSQVGDSQPSPGFCVPNPKRKRQQPALGILGVSSPPPTLDMSSTSHVDLEATPRAASPSKRRKYDLHVPLSFPRAASEASPSPTRSTNTSSAGGRSNRSGKSRSPVKDMADLALAEKPIRQVTNLKREDDYPPDVRPLLHHIRQIRRGFGIVPQPVAEQVQELLSILDNPIEEENVYNTNTWATESHGSASRPIDWDLDYELKTLKHIASRVETCISENVSEPSWNARIHEPLLDAALTPFVGLVSHWDVTKAVMDKSYIPRHGSGLDFESKMVDFCLTLDDGAVLDAVKQRLRSGNRKSINQTNYQPLRFRPIAISIETKTPDGSSQEAKAQLSVWTTAYIRRLRELAGTSETASGLGITLPILIVRGSQWELFFIVDGKDCIDILTLPAISDMRSILDCYKVVALIRCLASWSATTFRTWLLDNALVSSEEQKAA